MKYILNIVIVAMLMHCSIAWSMFLKPSGQGQTFAQKKMFERIEQQRLNAAKEILGKHSQNIQDMLKDLPGAEFNEIPFRASDQTIINLAKVYSDITQGYDQLKGLLDNQSLKMLEDMIKLDDFLDMMPTKRDDLKKIILKKVEKKSLSQLSDLKDLNSDLVQDLIKEFMSTKMIDSYLLKLYSDFLFTQRIEMPQYGSSYEPIYFDNKNGIQVDYNIKEKVLFIKRGGRVIKRMFLGTKNYGAPATHTFTPNKHDTFGLMEYLSIRGPRWSIINIGKRHLTSLLQDVDFFDESIKSCCFYGDNKLYAVDDKGNIYSCVDNYIGEKQLVTQLTIPDNETPHTITTNDDGTIVGVATETRLYIIDKNKNDNSFTSQDFNIRDMFINEKVTSYDVQGYDIDALNTPYVINQVRLNHTGSSFGIKLYWIVKAGGNRRVRIPLLYVYNKDQKRLEYKQLYSNESDDIIFRALKWIYDDALLMSNNYYSKPEIRHDSRFVVARSGNYWKYDYNLPCVSSDGTQGIITKWDDSLYKNRFFKVILYDDIMKAVINYFAQSTDEPVQKLFVIKLISTILDYRDSAYTFDETETEVYQNYVPQVIKTLLKKVGINTPSEEVKEQKIESAAVQAEKSIMQQGFRRELLERKRKAALYEKLKAQSE